MVELLRKEGADSGAKIAVDHRGRVNFSVPGIRTVFKPEYIDPQFGCGAAAHRMR